MNKDLIGIKKTEDYSLYSSDFVIGNQASIVEVSNRSHTLFKNTFKGVFSDRHKEKFKFYDSTRSFYCYNIFSLTSGDPYFYVIYQQIVAAIRDRVGDDRPLWMQCWLNYHKENEVLNWHNHDTTHTFLHGYLSVDPKNTVTEFRDFTIENKVGNLYVGRTGLEHRVVVREPYDDIRITLAFDVAECKRDNNLMHNLSFIPVP